MSKTDRQFAAVEIIREHGPLSADELRSALRQRRFNVSDKTFSRDETELLLRRSLLFISPNSEKLRTGNVPSV